MRRVDPPTLTVEDALDACLPHKRQELRDRLELVRDDLIEAEADFEARGPLSTLYEIDPVDDVAGIVTGDEMEALYTGTFSREGTGSRDLYDKLKQGAPNGMCPLCGGQQVKTLDHYLAKALHAPLTITPLNLIPACTDCNKAKHDDQPGNEAEQHLHPYFDDVDDERWLFAEVVEGAPASLKFKTSPPADWAEAKRERVAMHFKTLHHGALFASLSSDQLPSMRRRLRRLLDAGGPEAVRAHLIEELEGHLEERNNSWQIAMYAALSESNWYCEGGFDA